MRIAAIIGAISASTLVVTLAPAESSRSYPYRGKSPAPNDVGPVVDTTKESKRAKRRRLAKASPTN